jgi:hypothetical protein
MESLEYEWEDGEVGNFWLRIGLNYKVAHVYQTPWTGKTWWADAEAFGMSKEPHTSLLEAQEASEYAIERWFGRAIYRTPTYGHDDDIDHD